MKTYYVFDVPISDNREIYQWIERGVIKSYPDSSGLDRVREEDFPLIEKLLDRKCHKPSNFHQFND